MNQTVLTNGATVKNGHMSEKTGTTCNQNMCANITSGPYPYPILDYDLALNDGIGTDPGCTCYTCLAAYHGRCMYPRLKRGQWMQQRRNACKTQMWIFDEQYISGKMIRIGLGENNRTGRRFSKEL